MKIRRVLFVLVCVLALAGLAGFGLAQVAVGSAPASMDDGFADGEVRRIDRENLKITIRHGELRHLNMPPMTMVFQVRDPALLDRARPGDKVRFRAEEEAGQFFVTEILPAP
jgi:Cu/Ag efflux protein CusF